MRFSLILTIWSTTLLTLTGSAMGNVISVGPGAFSSGATLITFEGASGQITNQYVGEGVTVTGGVLYATGAYSANFGSPTAAANFTTGASTFPFVTLSFSAPIVRVGFDELINPGATLTVSDSDGSLTYLGPNPSAEVFAGFQDLAGFTSVTFGYSPAGTFNGAFAIDNLEFDVATPTPTPEPATMNMAGIAMTALFVVARLRKPRARVP